MLSELSWGAFIWSWRWLRALHTNVKQSFQEKRFSHFFSLNWNILNPLMLIQQWCKDEAVAPDFLKYSQISFQLHPNEHFEAWEIKYCFIITRMGISLRKFLDHFMWSCFGEKKCFWTCFFILFLHSLEFWWKMRIRNTPSPREEKVKKKFG